MMTDRPLIGLILALLVESPIWLKFRWDFNEEACAQAWQITTVMIALAGVLVFLESSLYDALPNLLTWLPALLIPMQFVQSYGLKDSMPVNTFSFLAKHRRRRNLRLGLTESVLHVNFGNVYFVAAMIACTLGSRSSGAGAWMFLPGIIVLTGWMLLSASRSRPASLVVALTVAGGIAVAGQQGLRELQERFGNSAPGEAKFDPSTVITLVGTPGAVEQSPEIVWRLRPVGNSVIPRLLRTATYNSYREGPWKHMPPSASQFTTLDTIEPVTGEIYHLMTDNPTPEQQREAIRDDLPRYHLRGAAFADTPLPIPGDATSVRDFELDDIERNGFGSVRLFPKNSVIAGTVLWKGDESPEGPPFPDGEDIRVPHKEKKTLDAVLEELQLSSYKTLPEKLQVISAYFQRDFGYTRSPTIFSPGEFSAITNAPTAITQFLTNAKAGHCEYFATATVLLLRQADIPARYAIGYAVVERDVKRGEFVIRGTHGHAWCRVWDESAGRWIDFDTTPGNLMTNLATPATAMQELNDSVRRFREDFFLWRNRPANRLAATLVMWSIGLGTIGFVIKRLWKSKRRLESEIRLNGYEGPVVKTPLHAVEPQAAKRLGMRPAGEPFAAWLLRLRPTLPDFRVLDEAIDLHQRLRFDPAPAMPNERDRLEELAKELESAMRRV